MSYSWKDGLPWHSSANRAHIEWQVAALDAKNRALAKNIEEPAWKWPDEDKAGACAQCGAVWSGDGDGDDGTHDCWQASARLSMSGGWRPKDTLPHPQIAGRFWAAINLSPSGDPEWQIDLIWLDDETHDIHADCGAHFSWNDYELWQPAVVPPAPIEERDE